MANRNECQDTTPEPKLRMTVNEALGWSDEWAKGRTFYADSPKWCTACVVLAQEVRRLREKAKKAGGSE